MYEPTLAEQAFDFLQLIAWAMFAVFLLLGAVRLAKGESMLFGDLGEPRGSTSPVMPPIGVEVAAALQKPDEVFRLWANARLVPSDAEYYITGNGAYEDYAETCRINGVMPLPSTRFGTMLTRYAEATNGAVIKTKNAGRMAYRGWRLAGEGCQGSGEASLPGEPLRGASPAEVSV